MALTEERIYKGLANKKFTRFSVEALFSLWRSRQALTRLEPHQLEDIGVSSAQAKAEAERPLWDVPQNWRV